MPFLSIQRGISLSSRDGAFILPAMSAKSKQSTKTRETQGSAGSATKIYPRSAYDRVGGIVYFARMLDKIRLHAAGKLSSDYHANLSKGFDGRCCRFLGVEYAALRERVLQGGSDGEILGWCFAKGRRPNEEEVLIWNSFLRKRGWRDDEDRATQELEDYKAGSGLSHRKDLLTFFDYYEVDEGRRK